MTAIRALLFDFDGTVIDTELPAFTAWQEVYRQHGHELTLDAWAGCLGTIGGFEPLAHLEDLVGSPVADREALDTRRRARQLELVAAEVLRPGLDAYLERAAELGIRIAIVSSDEDAWIASNLARVGRSDGWAHVVCANGDATRAKPHPCLYEEALAALGISAGEAVAFEDSPNGIRAAKSAGIFCVVVPNAVTRPLDLSGGDLLLESFEDLSLDDVLAAACRRP